MLVEGENPINKVFLAVSGNSGALHMSEAGNTTGDRVRPTDEVSTQVSLLSTDIHQMQRQMVDMKNEVRKCCRCFLIFETASHHSFSDAAVQTYDQQPTHPSQCLRT